MADRYLRNSGGNYDAAGTWELTPGGGEVVAVPTASDAVIATATSGNLTITAAAVALSVDLSAYTGTLVINASQTWTVSGNITLGFGMTWIATTGTLIPAAAGTLTSNGKKVPCAFSITNTTTMTLTFADSWEVDGAFAASGSTGNVLTFNGASFTLRCNGNVTISRPVSGSLGTFRFGGTGTWVGSATSTRSLGLNTEINTMGTLTIGSNARIGTGCTLTYIAGTIGSGTISLNGTVSLNVGTALSSCNLSVDGATTLTLLNALTVNQFGAGSNVTMSGSFNVTCTTLLFFGNSALTRVSTWTVGTLRINSGSFTVRLIGAFDQTIDNLLAFSGTTLTLLSGRVLTITSDMFMTANSATAAATLRADTASSPITLDFRGGYAGNRIFRAVFTDVNMAAGQTLWNYHGQALTRTNGIRNFTTPPVPRSLAYVG